MKLVLALALVTLAVAPASADGNAGSIDPSDLSGGGMYGDGTRWSEFTGQMSDLAGQAGQVAGGVSSGMNLFQQVTDMFDSLSDLDRALTDRLRDDHSGPEVPSSCSGSAASPTCAECFAKAYGEVNFTRNTLARLQTIHSRTMTYIKNAEGLGDTTSGIHAVTGLSWQYAKMDVEREKCNMVKASRDKNAALIQNMRRALDMVAACERDNFHNPDWYNRYGFMYFQFVQSAFTIDSGGCP